MKASLCYHNRQGQFTPVWQGALGQTEMSANLSIQQVKEFGVRQPCLADDALTMCLGKSNRSW